jgi:hypothetical protein
MVGLSLKERFARQGPVRGIDRVASGSPAGLLLVPVADHARVMTVSVAIELARRGMSLLQAKRAVEEMLDRGRVYVRLPVVEDVAGLVGALCGLGVVACVAPGVAADGGHVRSDSATQIPVPPKMGD